MSRALAMFSALARLWSSRARHPVTALAIATLLGACEGGSGQSGSAFVYLTVDGFSLSGQNFTASVNSSSTQGTTTTACVTLRNNLKNPTVTAPNTLDNVTVQSYTLTLSGGVTGSFTFGTGVLVPVGTVTSGNVGGNTQTFSVILVPAQTKGSPGTLATAELDFRGRDGRGQSVETEGAVTVVFVAGAEATTTCTTATPPPPPPTTTP